VGYYEALEDGIRFEEARHMTIYYPKCHICGNEVKSMNYLQGKKYTCIECKLEKKLSDKKKKVRDNFETKERKYDNAVSRYKKLGIGREILDYKPAFKKVYEKLHKYGWYDSTEEIMVAIELEKNNIKYRHQVKFGTRYRADFVLDDEKIVLEVDGVLFHTEDTFDRESIRDNLILMTLGANWEVIRISDELINQDITKLVSAIRKIKKERKKLRKSNNECLPNWYSDRE
jgi:very-short-patch-repair endonuclease